MLEENDVLLGEDDAEFEMTGVNPLHTGNVNAAEVKDLKTDIVKISEVLDNMSFDEDETEA